MFKRLSLTIIAIAIITIVVFFSKITEIYTDLLWFSSLGYAETFWTLFTANMQVIVIFSLLFALFFSINYFVLRVLTKHRGEGNSQWLNQLRRRFPKFQRKLNFWIFLLGLLFFTALMAEMVHGHWQEFLLAINATSFGQTDPIFGLDLSFFIFKLPFWDFVLNWAFVGLTLTLLFSIGYHFLSGGFAVGEGISVDTGTWAHLSLLAGLVIFTKAFSFRLDNYELLLSSSGVVFGAGYTQINAVMLANYILFFLSLAIAVALWFNIYKKSIKMPLVALAVFAAAWFVLKALIPPAIQKFMVEPDQLNKETPYIKHNIRMTRTAYGLNDFEEVEFPIKKNFNSAMAQKHKATLNNIRLWDYRPIKQTFSQLQEIRLYYNFYDIDIDRYTLDGQKRLVMLSAREMDITNLPKTADTWINRHMKYTHGYGLVLAPANDVTDEGQPRLYIKDIPPISKGGLKIDRPEIYYGELTNHYVLAGSAEQEFDYPKGNENAYTSYTGKGGIKMDTLWHKILFATRFQSSKIILADSIDDTTRILFQRNIRKRIKKIAPFLHLDSDPYIAIVNGRLKYIVDAYTTTDRFPYSERFPQGRFNYIRNSVKITVDAYDGDVQFYIFNPKDPIIRSYQKIFPELFQPASEMPQELTEHIRYPVTLFDIQMEIYRSYHMKDVQVFYNKEDMWQFPQEVHDSQKVAMQSYYQLLKLPYQDNLDFQLMMPFTPRGKNNLISLASAQSSGQDYGKVMIYKMPKDRLSYGPMQFEARVDQNPDISRQLSLWNQKGSKVIRGNTLIIPVEDTLLYVEPIFLKAEQSELPELIRVIVSTGSQLVMDKTFGGALRQMLQDKKWQAEQDKKQEQLGQQGQKPTTTREELIQKAQRLFNNAQSKLKKGNFSGYGQDIEDLGKVLNRL